MLCGNGDLRSLKLWDIEGPQVKVTSPTIPKKLIGGYDSTDSENFDGSWCYEGMWYDLVDLL